MKLRWLILGLGTASVFGACSASDGAGEHAAAGGGTGAGGSNSDASAGAAGMAGAGSEDASISGYNPKTVIVVIGQGADENAPNAFNGPDDPYASVEIAYPPDGILAPPNLNSLEVHFHPGAGQTLFEIRFESEDVALVVYTGCQPFGGGCVYQTDPTFWEKLVGPAKGKKPVIYRVRGASSVSATTHGTSSTRSMSFVKEALEGGLYYWNTAGVIQRYDFGFPLKTAEIFMTAQTAGALFCVGCHSLSRDGKKMMVGFDIPAPSPYKGFDVATRTPLTAGSETLQGTANYFSFSPDSKQYVYSDGLKIGWRDAETGKVLGDPIVPSGTMPDWSPDGKLLVCARANTPPPAGIAQPGVSSGALDLYKFDGSGFLGPFVLVPFDGRNNYYPAFAPSSDFVLFNRSNSNTDSMSNAPPKGDGDLWIVPAAGGNPQRLDAASDGGSTSWPKWVPGIFSYWGGTVMFFSFTSGRAYGVRLGQSERAQLWMSAFSPSLAKQGKDPSFPAIWFPYQDIAGGNHIAQWVTTVERQPCTQNSDCASGEQCVDYKCVPIVK